MQQGNGQTCASERCQREIGPGPCSPERTQAQNKQHKAGSIPGKSGQERAHQQGRRWKTGPRGQSQSKVDRACHQPFYQGDLGRISA